MQYIPQIPISIFRARIKIIPTEQQLNGISTMNKSVIKNGAMKLPELKELETKVFIKCTAIDQHGKCIDVPMVDITQDSTTNLMAVNFHMDPQATIESLEKVLSSLRKTLAETTGGYQHLRLH